MPKFDPGTAAAKTARVSKPGLIKLQDAGSQQLLEMYAALLGREPLNATLPAAKHSVRTQTEVSQAEAIYVLETIATLNNLAFEFVGEDKVRLIPRALARK